MIRYQHLILNHESTPTSKMKLRNRTKQRLSHTNLDRLNMNVGASSFRQIVEYLLTSVGVIMY